MKLKLNRTTIRGAAKILAGVAVFAGVLPAEAQAAIVENVDMVVGGITALWGMVAVARGNQA